MLAGLLRARAQLRSHEVWAREDLARFRAERLHELRAFAMASSPFYRDALRGTDDAPLERLPILTKATVMERFDDLVTDGDVHLADVEAYVRTASATDLFRGRYRVAGTAGTTGRRGLFLADPQEWATILASYARAEDWAGVSAGLTHRPRMAVVSTLNPTHQSAIVGATLASRFIPTLRLDAADRLERIVPALQAFEPEVLVGYASVLLLLAEEQAAGRLAIAPRAVMSASEVLTPDARARIHAAFGVDPTDVYGATETAGIASQCERRRMHLYEDLLIVEVVDEDSRPVPAGTMGARLLVTVLFSRTQPLIRYELTDRVAMSADACPCGRPFALVEAIEGREEDVLRMTGRGGRTVAVHPNVFHAVLEPISVAAWQVVQEDDGVRVLLAGAAPAVTSDGVGRLVRDALVSTGVEEPRVQVDLVEAIPRTKLGKAPLIRAAHHG